MSIIQVNQIKAAIDKRFRDLVDLSDVASSQVEDHFLTRGLAAFVIAELCRTEDPAAALSVVDEGHDGGIDALYFDTSERVCYLVQSKWVKDGDGSIGLDVALKFKEGVQHFFDADQTYFGQKMRKRWPLVRQILTETGNTYVLVLAYTGQQSLSPEVQRPLTEWVAKLNDPVESIRIQTLKQRDLHDFVAQRAQGDAINLEIMLRQWGCVRDPYVAYYGQVDLKDIATWGKYGPYLYIKNIRGFKGNTEVNEGIMNTIRKAPKNFWYFNNGITVVAERVTAPALGSGSHEGRVFKCEKASVVNGAQTVGSICSAVNGGANSLGDASVLVRIISLDNCPSQFGDELAKAANTQNRIENKDYVTQDPLQGRLCTELFLENKKKYVYRTGDSLPAQEEGFTFEEAASALACAHPNIGYCVQAKREVGKLWEDIKKPPYTVLFSEKTSAVRMWRAVEIMRAVDAELKTFQSAHEGRQMLIASHGSRFILYMAFRSGLDPDNTNLESTKEKVPATVKPILEKLTKVIFEHYQLSYPASLFKNVTICKELAQQMGMIRKDAGTNQEDFGPLFPI